MVAHLSRASGACPFSRSARTGPLQGAAVSKLSASAMANFLQVLLAVVLGNVAYFVLAPSFPPVARHRPFHFDLGMAIDFWFCLVAYGLIRTARRWK
jgi:hypothetical protein